MESHLNVHNNSQQVQIDNISQSSGLKSIEQFSNKVRRESKPNKNSSVCVFYYKAKLISMYTVWWQPKVSNRSNL